MSKMRSGGSSHGIAPKIEVRDLPEEQLDIVTQGPGLYFGTVLENGHCETCRFYDYPGGILTQTVTTRVMRKVKILDEDCFEVLIEHSDCQPPEPNLLDYFSVSNAGFHWIMRVVADENLPVTRFMDRDREIFPLKYSVGEHEDYHARTVELTMGDDFRQRCLAVFWGWKNGTPVESYFTVEGRQVLHRRFVGPGAPESSNYQYEKLLQEMRRPFRGKDYRLWYETVLLP